MEEKLDDRLNKTVELIKKAKGFFALTGAGISTESGLPDFRSPGTGIWEKVDPIKTSSAQVFKSNPRLFFEAGFKRFITLQDAQPNKGHYALAKMEKMNILKGIVTQNIDGLHYKAGSRNIWEVHGHLRTGHCIECGRSYPFEYMVEQLDHGHNPPFCENCSGIVRPDVVLFGDPMGKSFFEAERTLANECDLLLVVGSSLTVYPVASLPQYVSKIVIINLQPTPYDDRAEVVFREKSGSILSKLLQLLEK